jgi:hypothetical protein
MKITCPRFASLLLITVAMTCGSAPLRAIEKNEPTPQPTPQAGIAADKATADLDAAQAAARYLQRLPATVKIGPAASQQAFADQLAIQKALESKRQLDFRPPGTIQIDGGFSNPQPGGDQPGSPQNWAIRRRPFPDMGDLRQLDASTSSAPRVGGYFDVTLLGFTVNHQTRDDLLENDGRGDEVFLRCATLSYDRISNSLAMNTSLATKTFGDINRHSARRIQAGNAGSNGGLQSGNSVPSRNPSQPVPADERGDRLPLHVFGGMLIPGRDEVLIAPTMWEWDDLGETRPFWDAVGDIDNPPFPWHGGGDNDRASRLQSAIETRSGNIAAAVRTLDPRSAHGNFLTSGRTLRFPFVGGDMGGNRPIGMTAAPEGSPDGFEFTPQVLVLNFATADRLAHTRFDLRTDIAGPDSTMRTSTSLLPPGVIPIHYVDQGDLGGDYTLFVHIQRVY